MVFQGYPLHDSISMRGPLNRTMSFHNSILYQKQQSLQYGFAPDTWMLGGIALIVTLAVLLLFMLRCAVYYVPRCFGYEAASRLEGPGHSLGMYSLDLQAHTKNRGYANVGYLHRESVTDA